MGSHLVLILVRVVVENVVLNMNYFEIFGLPVNFNIDEQVLMKIYLQKQREAAMEDSHNAALINNAYNTLKNPLKRGEYFLSLHNLEDRELSSEFTMKMFDLRENYSNLKEEDAKINFQNQLKEKIKSKISKLSLCSGDINRFQEEFLELKFLNSFWEKIKIDVYSRN